MGRRSTALVIAAVAVLAMPAVATAQSTLDGEVFSQNPGEGTLVITSASCDPTGTSTFSFFATGPATGPYPGTFEESGTITIGPHLSSTIGAALTVTAFFTIDSVNGDVTGTKSFTGPSDTIASQGGLCLDAGQTLRSVNLNSAGVTYSATITTSSGTFHDEGDADINVLEQTLASLFLSDFRQAFFSDLTEVQKVRPGLGCGDANHTHERELECHKLAR